jgi:hypothetical protein
MKAGLPASLLPTLLLCLASAGAHAEYPSIEDAAAITDAHTVRLERDSIARQADLVRFDVWVGWKDPATRPQGEAARKVVRYLARCQDGTLAVSSVATFPTAGQPGKTYGIAPGGWDFEPPAAGSPGADWLKRVCDAAN